MIDEGKIFLSENSSSFFLFSGSLGRSPVIQFALHIRLCPSHVNQTVFEILRAVLNNRFLSERSLLLQSMLMIFLVYRVFALSSQSWFSLEGENIYGLTLKKKKLYTAYLYAIFLNFRIQLKNHQNNILQSNFDTDIFQGFNSIFGT